MNIKRFILKHEQIFFQLLFGSPTANFGPLSKEHPQLLDINHRVSTILT